MHLAITKYRPKFFGVVVPKSGNTWLTRMVNQQCRLENVYNFRNDQDQLFKSISSNQLKSCRAIVGRGDVNTIDFLRDNGIAVRPFLLIRHPVDRLISSFRAIQGSETRKSKCEITELKI